MHKCKYAYMHFIHTYYLHTYTHAEVHVCMHILMHTDQTFIHIRTYIHTCLHAHI